MAFRVLYDANALFGALQRSILVRVGVAQARFNLRVLLTDRILDEMVDAVRTKYSNFSEEQGESLKKAIGDAIPDCRVIGYEYAIEGVDIRDPGDRHVVTAAIHATVQLIITDDLDFTATALTPHDLEAQSPDDFLTDLFGLDAAGVRQIVSDEAAARDCTIEELVDLLEQRGLIRLAQHLRR
ncbi:MAG TPA: PIN domain-containing protein [Acidimicrobiia bacterium]|nr:PIN domain-containing protein [Acidimicrobiia bacterium]